MHIIDKSITDNNSIYIGEKKADLTLKKVKGEEINVEGESFYKISNSDFMRPFFMSIVSDSDHWMFISSNGSLSAGRKNCNYAIFPYYTDDKITELGERPVIYQNDDDDSGNLKGGGRKKKQNEDDGKNLEIDLLTTIFETLEETVNNLSLIIYDTDKLLSYKLKEDIIFEYRKLTKQKAKYFTFIGPQPITLNKGGIDINNPGSILVDFAVTEKADGDRYELFIINGLYNVNILL